MIIVTWYRAYQELVIGNLKQLIRSVYRQWWKCAEHICFIGYKLTSRCLYCIPRIEHDRARSGLTSNCYRDSLSGVLKQYRESEWWWLRIRSEHCYWQQFVNFRGNKVRSNESIERTENWLLVVPRTSERLTSGGLHERARHDWASDTGVLKFGRSFLGALRILSGSRIYQYFWMNRVLVTEGLS